MESIPMMTALKFLAPCEHRELAPGSETSAKCHLISNAVGHGHGVNATVCAACALHGQPDKVFLDNEIYKIKAHLMNLAKLGFYKNDADILHIIRTAWPYMKARKDAKTQMSIYLEKMVALNRITYEQAEDLVKNHIQELLADGDLGTAAASCNKTANASGGIGAKRTSSPPVSDDAKA